LVAFQILEKTTIKKIWPTAKSWTSATQFTVHRAQADFVTQDENAALVETTDAYGYSDPWHYDSPGYLDLGRQFADAVHKCQNEAK
jgi:hypothetical protein